MTRLLETGDVYFVYRPRTGARRVSGLADVAALYVVFHPYRRDGYRLLRLARHTLPETSNVGQSRWTVVETVGHRPEDIEDYPISRSGEPDGVPSRYVEPPGLPARGTYGIVRHDDHTHLAYVRELPATTGPVQRAPRPATS